MAEMSYEEDKCLHCRFYDEVLDRCPHFDDISEMNGCSYWEAIPEPEKPEAEEDSGWAIERAVLEMEEQLKPDKARCRRCRDCRDHQDGICRNVKSKRYALKVDDAMWACERYRRLTRAEPQTETLAISRKTAMDVGALREENAGLILALGQVQQSLGAMAEMLRVTNERMTAMEETMRTLEKITQGQQSQLNKMIRLRAVDVCEEYLLGEDNEKAVAALIRKEIKKTTGAQAARDIPRCDWGAVVDLITGWDDYEAIMAIKAKGAGV